MHYPRKMKLEWRRIHNSSVSTFLIYLNWWSTFVAGGLSFIPMLPSGCQPRTAFPYMSSWIELFTVVMLVSQSVLLLVSMKKLETKELVNEADTIVLIYHGISLIMPTMFLLLTNVITEDTIEASKTILPYHFAQNLANTIKNIEPPGIRATTKALSHHEGQLGPKIERISGLTRCTSCYTNYFLSSMQIFVALSILTPFLMKLLEVLVPPGINEPVLVPRPTRHEKSPPTKYEV